MSVGNRSPVFPREISSMPCMMLIALSPCSLIFSIFVERSSAISSKSAASSSSIFPSRSATISFRSASNLSDIFEKLITKFSGFCISCAIPALSFPSDANFCCSSSCLRSISSSVILANVCFFFLMLSSRQAQ